MARLFDRTFGRSLVICSVAASVLGSAWIYQQGGPLRMKMQWAADRPSQAQVFFNTGHGFVESESVKLQVRSKSLQDFQTLAFDLPGARIQELRIDPANSPGTFLIRGLVIEAPNGYTQQVSVSQLLPFHEVTTVQRDGEAIRVATTPNATDPGIIVRPEPPLQPQAVLLREAGWRLLSYNGALIFGSMLAWRGRRRLTGVFTFRMWALTGLNRRMEEWGKSISDPNFIRFDALAIWTYLICAVCFAGAVAADLNGSSCDMLNRMFKRGAQETPLMGEPRAIRSDEWGYATPDVLSQALRTERFAVTDSDLGTHSVALLGNIPVRHVSTVLRPQFWGFFFLPVDFGFAYFWQSKAFFLVVGVFTWILMLSGSSKWALTGALWYFFSPAMQWSYSWPSGLPEMIGLSCLACVAFCYLTVGQNRLRLLVASTLAILWSVDFAMCSYLPHMLPLALLQMAVLAAWSLGARTEILGRTMRAERIAAVLFALAGIAAFGGLIYQDVHQATAAIANTAYPGQRVASGGTIPILGFAAQLLPWFQTEDRFPELLANISEGSGFLWLAPVTLLGLKQVSFSRLRRALYLALLIYFLVIAVWLTVPLAPAVGAILGLNRTFGGRCIPALGLANIAIVSVYLANHRFRPEGLSMVKVRGAIGIAAMGFLLFVFSLLNKKTNHFFTQEEMVSGSLFLAVIIVAMLTSHKRILPLVLVGSQALFFGAVNPVQRGVGVFTSSDLYRFVHSNGALTKGRWLIYTNQPTLSGLFAGVGCQIFTGTHYLPDIDHFAQFRKRGLDLNVWNRLGYLVAVLPDADGQTKMRLINNVISEWKVAPTDPLLRQIGIHYVAFDTVSELPPAHVTAHLIPLADHAIDGFWLYQLP